MRRATAGRPAGRRKATGRSATRSLWLELLLNAGAVAGLICLVSALAAVVLGLTPLVFSSGSMSPAINSGDLAVARSVSASQVGVGDIVSVTDRSGARVTHRVQAVEPFGSQIRLILKGDANAAPDAETYAVASVDKVLFAVPGLGRLSAWATGPLGVIAGGICVACTAYVAFTPGRRYKGARRR